MTPKRQTRRTIQHELPASDFLTRQRLADEAFMTYRKAVHTDLKPTNKRQREIVDRFADLAWRRKELEEQLSELRNSPMAAAQAASGLRSKLDEALRQLILLARELSRMQKQPIVLLVPNLEPGVEDLPPASTQVQ
jgi:septal ring factor EnvC (AmiA/AmiB activator)